MVVGVRGEEMAGMYAGVGWDASRERGKGGVIHNVMGGCRCVGCDAVIYNVHGWVCGVGIFNVKRWRGCRAG